MRNKTILATLLLFGLVGIVLESVAEAQLLLRRRSCNNYSTCNDTCAPLVNRCRPRLRLCRPLLGRRICIDDCCTKTCRGCEGSCTLTLDERDQRYYITEPCNYVDGCDCYCKVPNDRKLTAECINRGPMDPQYVLFFDLGTDHQGNRDSGTHKIAFDNNVNFCYKSSGDLPAEWCIRLEPSSGGINWFPRECNEPASGSTDYVTVRFNGACRIFPYDGSSITFKVGTTNVIIDKYLEDECESP